MVKQDQFQGLKKPESLAFSHPGKAAKQVYHSLSFTYTDFMCLSSAHQPKATYQLCITPLPIPILHCKEFVR